MPEAEAEVDYLEEDVKRVEGLVEALADEGKGEEGYSEENG